MTTAKLSKLYDELSNDAQEIADRLIREINLLAITRDMDDDDLALATAYVAKAYK